MGKWKTGSFFADQDPGEKKLLKYGLAARQGNSPEAIASRKKAWRNYKRKGQEAHLSKIGQAAGGKELDKDKVARKRKVLERLRKKQKAGQGVWE